MNNIPEYDIRGKDTNKSKFWQKKDCVILSIREVECFLHNLDKACKCIFIYKFLK